jgi:hypothetical protein
MARAMAERLEYVVPCQLKPLAARQTVQEPAAFPIEAAKGLLLQAASQHSPQQVLAQSRRRHPSEDRPPAPPKGIQRKQQDARDFGLDGGGVCQAPPHG